jgi:hypothetical protein
LPVNMYEVIRILIFENRFVVLEIFDFGPCEPITHRTNEPIVHGTPSRIFTVPGRVTSKKRQIFSEDTCLFVNLLLYQCRCLGRSFAAMNMVSASHGL